MTTPDRNVEAVRTKRKRGARIGGALRARLAGNVRKCRRETIYKMTAQRHGGQVPCFVCGRHVTERRATLEHIVRLRDGGTDDMSNLAISHEWCNSNRDRLEGARDGDE